jgi:glycosyltransferase involved in cell wall biosynthesis
MSTRKPVGVSILTSGNRLPLLEQCVRAFLAYCAYRPLVIAVFDNASSHDPMPDPEAYAVEWRYERSDTNLGVSMGTNRALAMADDCEYGIHIESDFELLPPHMSGHDRMWLHRAIEHMENTACDYLYLRRMMDQRDIKLHWWDKWASRVREEEDVYIDVPGFWWSNNPALRHTLSLKAQGVLPIPERPGEHKGKPNWGDSELKAKAPAQPWLLKWGVFIHETASHGHFMGRPGCGFCGPYGASSCKYGFFMDPDSPWCRTCDTLLDWTDMPEHKARNEKADKGKLGCTVVSVWTNRETLDKILLPCLSHGMVERLLVKGQPNFCLAKAYNKALDEARTDIVSFIHPDVDFSPDALVEACSVIKRDDIGAVGLVGAEAHQKQVWATSRCGITDVQTLDSCFLVIDRRKGFRFDEETFDELHLCVEDYCCQVRDAELRAVVVDCASFNHHSETWSVRGCNWGKYPLYRERLRAKWGDVATT